MSRGTGKSHPRFDEYSVAVSLLIRMELQRAKIPYFRLAKRMGYHRSNLCLMLNGKSLPTPALVVLIAKELKIPISRLLPKRINIPED